MTISDAEINEKYIDPIYRMEESTSVEELKKKVPHKQILLYSLITLVSSSINGGMRQYFMNCGPGLNQEIKDALIELGMGEKTKLFDEAFDLFRKNPHAENEDRMKEIENEFGFLDVYYKALNYIRTHQNDFIPLTTK